jgi:AbiV family abortive infection protein
MPDKKRKYRSGVDFVVSDVRECCKNALGLATDAQATLDRGSHALALSIAVLALEELGKATMITREVRGSALAFNVMSKSHSC